MTILGSLMVYARLHQSSVLSVQTGSMTPVIRAGDAVIVEPLIGGLAVGDIVSYRASENPALIITHRIVSIDQAANTFIARGDDSRENDQVASTAQIVGRVEVSIPYVGTVLDAVRRPLGLVLAIYVPAISVAVTEIQRLSRYYAAQRYRLHGYRRYRYPPIPSRISYS